MILGGGTFIVENDSIIIELNISRTHNPYLIITESTTSLIDKENGIDICWFSHELSNLELLSRIKMYFI